MDWHRLGVYFVWVRVATVLAGSIFLNVGSALAAEPGNTSGHELTDVRSAIEAARDRAPEVARARAALKSSQSATENGRLAPFGNPHLELTAQSANQDVVEGAAVA